MEEIGNILPRIFKRQVGRTAAQSAVVEVLGALWPRVAGKLIAEHCRPVAFASGTLTLATSCASWAAELRRMAEEFQAKINSFLGSPAVKRLRVELVPNLEPPGRAAPERCLEAAILTDPAPDDLESKLDPETRRILSRSFAKYFSRPGRKVHGWH